MNRKQFASVVVGLSLVVVALAGAPIADGIFTVNPTAAAAARPETPEAAAMLLACLDDGQSGQSKPPASQPTTSAPSTAPAKAPARTELLPVGAEAPDWTLSTPDGTAVTLKSLRGKVVVLDFWAVWCGPCKKAMPGIQKLHEKFKDKPVVVYGIDTWERGNNDPAAYMKKSGFTYGLLLKGDAIAPAYGIRGIPVFYVIGVDGKVVYAAAGSENEGPLGPAVEQALKQVAK
jgi:thiol-disulfide isomerase/thioredoxin